MENAGGNHAGEEEVGEQAQEQEMEVGQAAGFGAGKEERPANSNACCICHEPWASCGAHRICCIPCGHVYGRSCLEAWLIRSGYWAAKCLWCAKQFKREDIVNLYGTTEHLWDDGHHEQAARQVAVEDEEAEVARHGAEDSARGNLEVAQGNLEIAEGNLEVARGNLGVARGNLEVARRNAETARRNEAMFTAMILVLVGVLLYRSIL